jgi:hypothetical protein
MGSLLPARRRPARLAEGDGGAGRSRRRWIPPLHPGASRRHPLSRPASDAAPVEPAEAPAPGCGFNRQVVDPAAVTVVADHGGGNEAATVLDSSKDRRAAARHRLPEVGLGVVPRAGQAAVMPQLDGSAVKGLRQRLNPRCRSLSGHGARRSSGVVDSPCYPRSIPKGDELAEGRGDGCGVVLPVARMCADLAALRIAIECPALALAVGGRPGQTRGSGVAIAPAPDRFSSDPTSRRTCGASVSPLLHRSDHIRNCILDADPR